MLTGDAEHVALVGSPQRHLDLAHAIDAVGRHPGKRHLCLDGPLDHGERQLRLGGERDRLGHMRRLPSGWIPGPDLGQVQVTVDEGVTLIRGVKRQTPRSGSW